MRLIRLNVAATILVLTGIACERHGPTAPDSISIEDLRQAPTTVQLSGKSFTLAAELWRDFQPISPADGKPLAAVIRVSATDATPVPTPVVADAAWVVFGDQIWTATPHEQFARGATSLAFEAVLRDGPKWGPGIAVDVVVRLSDGTSRSALLRAPNQMIQSTF